MFSVMFDEIRDGSMRLAVESKNKLVILSCNLQMNNLSRPSAREK